MAKSYEHGGHVDGVHRLTKEIALVFVTSHFGQEIELGLCFHAFGDDLELEFMSQINHG